MIDTVTVEVTENDIIVAVNNMKESPLDIAVARHLKIDMQRIEVKLDDVLVWMYDDSDYVQYKYTDEESYIDVYDFLQEWELFMEDESMEEFTMKPFNFGLEKKHDPRTESRHWATTSFDYSEFSDVETHDKKKLRKRLTDDEY